jgi:hypothetical protein
MASNKSSVSSRGSIHGSFPDAPQDATTFEFDEHLFQTLKTPAWLSQNAKELDIKAGQMQVRVVGPMNAIVVRNSQFGTHGIAEHSILASVNGECVLLLPFDAVMDKMDSMERPLTLKFLSLPSHEGKLDKLPRGKTPDNSNWQNRWFEVKNGILYYYDGDSKKQCKGELFLKGASVHRYLVQAVLYCTLFVSPFLYFSIFNDRLFMSLIATTATNTLSLFSLLFYFQDARL